MIQTLSVILLTSRELKSLRERLRSFHPQRNKRADAETVNFFVTLYEAFCNNAVAVVSLCLLCELYEHATRLLTIIGGYEMTVEFLCEMDKLVQLVESPVFASMRLQLLDPAKYPFLYRSMYALLMILPQSAAFVTLNRRLSCVTSGPLLGQSALQPATPPKHAAPLDFDQLTQTFSDTQQKQLAHRDALREAKNREVLAEGERTSRKLMDAIKKRAAII